MTNPSGRFVVFGSAHEELGITISYWENEEAITA
tara:strand:+ start:592 stop:693 length:102 start_codon:yes stop_codon:yes gene_type:complete